MVFTRTCDNTRKLALMLRNLGFDALPIHGQMSQPKRLAALNKFKGGERSILVATGAATTLTCPSPSSLCDIWLVKSRVRHLMHPFARPQATMVSFSNLDAFMYRYPVKYLLCICRLLAERCAEDHGA